MLSPPRSTPTQTKGRRHVEAAGIQGRHARIRRPSANIHARRRAQTTELLGATTLVPVYHCGYYCTLSRSLEEQKKDWQRAVAALTAPSSQFKE